MEEWGRGGTVRSGDTQACDTRQTVRSRIDPNSGFVFGGEDARQNERMGASGWDSDIQKRDDCISRDSVEYRRETVAGVKGREKRSGPKGMIRGMGVRERSACA